MHTYQTWHEVADWYVEPAGQTSHEELPAIAWYAGAVQVEQAEAPEVDEVPIGQDAHALLEYIVPARHNWHDDWFVIGAIVPTGHDRQAVEPE